MTVIDLLPRGLGAFVEVSERVDDPRRASRCAGWSISDVVAHVVVVTDRFTRFAADAPLDPSADLAAAVARAVATWRANHDALQRVCSLSFGTFDGATAAGINLFDAVVHAWDIAAAVGLPYAPDDDVVEHSIEIGMLLVWDERQYARPRDIAPITQLDRLLVLTGRDPRGRD